MTTIALLVCATLQVTPVSLAGDWTPIRLPGTLSTAGQGEPMTRFRQQVWGGQFTDVPIWHPQLRYDTRDVVTYSRTIDIPAAWEDKAVELFLERVCWTSEAFVDGRSVGRQDSLSAPHVHRLGVLKPGKHVLAVAVDNRPLHDLGCNTHAYHEQSCTIYNGIIGRIELSAVEPVNVVSARVFADPETGDCRFDVRVENGTDGTREALVAACVDTTGDTGTSRVALAPGQTNVAVVVHVAKRAVRTWSEFTPAVYAATVTIGASSLKTTFGFRSFEARGTRFFINGKPVLLRGEVNNAQFPLTGHPPMNEAAWREIMALYKSFGLNHVRFHAWTPPEAAFAAADALGLYLEPELPNGEGSIATDSREGLAWRRREGRRILDTYGNHPSFVLFSGGNEAKTREIQPLRDLVAESRAYDPRHLYASIANPEASGILNEVPGDDYGIAHGSPEGRRRMESVFNRQPPETTGDYRATMASTSVPQICHEMGQWYVYPCLSEIARWTGALRPVTLERFRETAERSGVLARADDFQRESGRLSLELYKEEIERALRTPDYGGFQLLGLQDSFDQGAAYVGMVDSFFTPKPFVSAAKFRSFCASQVPLARMSKRVWFSDETFRAEIDFANYGPAAIRDAKFRGYVREGDRMLAEWRLSSGTVPDTGLVSIGRVKLPLSREKRPVQLTLGVSLEGSAIRNEWKFWVYPRELPAEPKDVLVVETFDAAAREALGAGGAVALFSRAYRSPYPTAMTPPFWSPVMFGNQKQVLGLLCDRASPALRLFPTEGHSDWQWFDILRGGSAIRLHDVPKGYRPIVQAIDRPDRNDFLALVYETRVGKGRLLVSTLDLATDLDARPAARQLRASLLAYAASRDFRPRVELPLEGNLPETGRSSVLARLSPKVTATTEHENFWAAHAVDGNPDTHWHSNWNPPLSPLPHALTVELKKPITFTGLRLTPRTDCPHGQIAACRIETSDDGATWRTIATETFADPSRVQIVRFKSAITARFIRLVSLREVGGRSFTSLAELDVIPKEEK